MPYAYISGLVVALLCLHAIDYRYKLAWYKDRTATIKTIVVMLATFLVWDVAGINLGIFFIGDTQVLSGVKIAPEIPLEEVFFLILLSYQPLLLWTYFDRRRQK